MPYCEDCGKPIAHAEPTVCDACLVLAWDELRQRANVWNIDSLRAFDDDPPARE